MSAVAKGYGKIRVRLLQRLTRHASVALLLHWAFQSLLYMDRTERAFKLGLDGLLTLAIGGALGLWLPWPAALLVGFGAAHTLNFLFNGHLWGALKHYGRVQHHEKEFNAYVTALCARARRERSIKRLIVFGSLARQEWASGSDFDARIVRHAGLSNGVQACVFLLKERARALIAGFPLDMYVLDHERALARLNPNERPIDLLQQR